MTTEPAITQSDLDPYEAGFKAGRRAGAREVVEEFRQEIAHLAMTRAPGGLAMKAIRAKIKGLRARYGEDTQS